MMSGNDIRRTFLNYFEEQGHTIVKSSSLVPSNDPTLLFTNAGMVQFKNVFLGDESRPYSRATSSQRCLRAGGKHNDLENVGHTARHHTFFEMLGNFSFGDYFKKEAIPFAWQLVTERLGLDPNRLLVTVYHEDDEAYDIWNKDVGLSKDKIIRIATKDNFWSMGDEGPCGPCTEIFYDNGDHVFGGPPGSADEDGDRFMEIWNVVFMQYYMQGGEIVRKLERTGVDTGAGLERVTSVCQGKINNYDTDFFQPVIQKAAEMAGIKYGATAESDVSLRVIADHIRAMSFLMVDGVMPSNEGRGYVLRRIMRRAMRHGNLLGFDKPFIYNLLPALVNQMGEGYPELGRGAQMVSDTIKTEEERFSRTLSQGLKLLEDETRGLSKGSTLSGDVAFKLYDTYGFPLDLTEDALKARGIAVDNDGFTSAMNAQRERARKGGLGTGQEKLAAVWFDLRDKLPATEFVGYTTTQTDGAITALVKGDKKVESLKAGESGIVLVNQTPFYGEGGGQVGDQGVISAGTATAKVTDTQKLFDGTLFQHIVTVEKGELKVGDAVNLMVDAKRRENIRRHHSATHLLHSALRNVLGSHVFQKGSLVTAERLRFDFSHPKALTAEEITAIETQVNNMIWANVPVETRLMDQEAAIKAGALALFGEKYGDEVRVLSMGNEGNSLSVELCGGTHVSRTGDIGLIRIVGESSVASGVRRVEAVAGEVAYTYLRQMEEQLKEAAGSVKARPDELVARIAALQNEKKQLEKELKQARMGGGSGSGDKAGDLVKSAEDLNGVRFIGAEVEGLEAGDLRTMVDDLKNRIGSGVVVLGLKGAEKPTLIVGVTADLTQRFNAGQLVNGAAEKIGGRGGGRPDMAMAGGTDAANLDQAIAYVKTAISA